MIRLGNCDASAMARVRDDAQPFSDATADVRFVSFRFAARPRRSRHARADASLAPTRDR